MISASYACAESSKGTSCGLTKLMLCLPSTLAARSSAKALRLQELAYGILMHEGKILYCRKQRTRGDAQAHTDPLVRWTGAHSFALLCPAGIMVLAARKKPSSHIACLSFFFGVNSDMHCGRGACAGKDELVVMVLDVMDDSSGRFLVWGADASGASVLLCVADFEPYFYIAAPRDQARPGSFAVQSCNQLFGAACTYNDVLAV